MPSFPGLCSRPITERSAPSLDTSPCPHHKILARHLHLQTTHRDVYMQKNKKKQKYISHRPVHHPYHHHSQLNVNVKIYIEHEQKTSNALYAC